MNRLLLLALTAGLLSPVAAEAESATMILHMQGFQDTAVTIPFPSMEDCEASSNYISQLRSPVKTSNVGLSGVWKFNKPPGRSLSGTGHQYEPFVRMVCVPSTKKQAEKWSKKLRTDGNFESQ